MSISPQWGDLCAPRQRSLEKQRADVAPEHEVNLRDGLRRAGGVGADAIVRKDVEYLAEGPVDDAGQFSVTKHDDAPPPRPPSALPAAPTH